LDVQAHRIGICSSSPRPDPPELGEAELEVGELDAAELTAEACAVPWARRRGKEAVEREGWRHPVLLLLPGSSSPGQSCCCPRREGRGGRRAELAQICHHTIASTATHPVAVEGARPPAGRGGVELGHPRWRGWRSAGVREEACRGGPSRAAGVQGEGSPEWKAWGSRGMREGDESQCR